MNDRHRAIDILQRARDMLADRLTERVLESKDGILEDAAGFSADDEIAGVYGEIGSRLSHISQMLANLPAEKSPVAESADGAGSATGDAAPVEPLALPGPTAGSAPMLALLPPDTDREPATVQSFLTAIHTDDLDAAGRVLADLLGLTDRRGRQCAAIFRERMLRDTELVMKAIKLRYEVSGGSTDGVLLLLHECFGMQIAESLAAAESLKAHHG